MSFSPETLLREAGWLHPVLVHLPIGLVAGAVLLAIRDRSWDDRRGWVLLDAALAFGLLALATGWGQSQSGGFEEAAVARHRNLALATVGVLGLARALLASGSLRLARATLLGGALCMVFAGHYGGVLTHGAPSPPGVGSAQARAHRGEGAEARKTLEASCGSCHGPRKQEGRLRLDSREALLRGGKSGRPAVVAGDAAASELVKRLLLPKDHPGHMPPKSAPDLAPEQALALARWIADGAPWAAAPDAGRLKEARRAGVRLEPLSAKDTGFSADLRGLPRDRIPGALAALAPLALHVRWLDVSGAAAGDAELAGVARLAALKKLDLSNTLLSDDGMLALRGLQGLEILNLYGTRVTDRGLGLLHGLPALRRLYVWKARTTPAGREALSRGRPALAVVADR